MTSLAEHSDETAPITAGSPPVRAASDSLAVGLVFMLVLAVVQRLVGFVRSVLFCGLLQDDELGRWSLAFSFLLLAGPLTVVGLPGSFGRYVEHYRSRGQLGVFLRRTITVSLALVVLSLSLLTWCAPFWAWLVFGDEASAHTVRLLALTLVAVIGFNFVTELLTAMRKVRAVSVMQFVSSIVFAVTAIVLIKLTTLRDEAVIIAFGVSAIAALLVVVKPLRDVQLEASAVIAPLPQRDLWQKLVPFAAWIWLTNILANLFDAADRFMIVHFAQESAACAESLVGQYHSSRVVPYLLISVTTMVAGVLLPYLSHDWELGRKHAVGRRQTMTLKLGGLILTALGAVILLAAPLLFTWLLQGKYDQGLAVLPWTLTYCVWFSMIVLAQNYLFCAEKARLGTLAFLVGLVINLVLNVLLLPRFGLVGAIAATTVGNAVGLLLVVYFSHRCGLVVDRDVVICCALPMMLILGPFLAAAAVLALTLLILRRDWLFDHEEREELLQVARAVAERVERMTRKRPPVSACERA